MRPGEIHALVGENGAGKSTCISLLYGLNKPKTGEILFDGAQTQIQSPAHAQQLGVGCVFQELSLAGSLSVAENIFAGRAPSKFGKVIWSELRARAEALLAEFDLTVDVSKPVDSLPISSRQIVEIAKALSLDSRVLLLDEPTSALTPDEVEGLFSVLRNLTQKGIGIVYVSHHMSEIFQISDRITVLRDGQTITTESTAETTQAHIVSSMIGSAHPGDVERSEDQLGDVLMRVNNLSDGTHFEDVSFGIRRGEIVGLAGLLGSRRSEIVRSLIGLGGSVTGKIEFKGQEVSFNNLRAAMDANIGFVPEERKTEGLFLDYPISTNLAAANLEKHTRLGMLNGRSIARASRDAIDAFSVKTGGPDEIVGSLSGGNQQKILLSKWLEREPELLIIEEPTKGVDVGAKFQIHTELKRRAAAGTAIIIVSSDFPELVALSNRILVVHQGQVVADVLASEADEDGLIRMAAGLPAPTDASSNLYEGKPT